MRLRRRRHPLAERAGGRARPPRARAPATCARGTSRGRRRAPRAAAIARCRSSASSRGRSGARRTRTRRRARRRRRVRSPEAAPAARARPDRPARASDRRSRGGRGRRARRRRRGSPCRRPRCGSGSWCRGASARRRRPGASRSTRAAARAGGLREKTTAPLRRSTASAAVREGSTWGTERALVSRFAKRRVGGLRRRRAGGARDGGDKRASGSGPSAGRRWGRTAHVAAPKALHNRAWSLLEPASP